MISITQIPTVKAQPGKNLFTVTNPTTEYSLVGETDTRVERELQVGIRRDADNTNVVGGDLRDRTSGAVELNRQRLLEVLVERVPLDGPASDAVRTVAAEARRRHVNLLVAEDSEALLVAKVTELLVGGALEDVRDSGSRTVALMINVDNDPATVATVGGCAAGVQHQPPLDVQAVNESLPTHTGLFSYTLRNKIKTGLDHTGRSHGAVDAVVVELLLALEEGVETTGPVVAGAPATRRTARSTTLTLRHLLRLLSRRS